MSGISPGLLLEAAGLLLVLAALAVSLRRPARRALLLAAAGCAIVGTGGTMDGSWPAAVATWAMAAFLAVQWARLERKARRR